MVELETEVMNEGNLNPIPLLPLKNVVILPKSINPIIVGRVSSIKAVEYALKTNKTLLITAQKHPDIESPAENDLFTYGTKSTILQVMRMAKGTLKILVEGICRARITKIEQGEGFLGAYAEDLETTSMEPTIELMALWRQLQSMYTTYSQFNSKIPADLLTSARTPEDIDSLVDTLSVHLNIPFDERQLLLETIDLKERLLKTCSLLQKEIEILEMEERIRGRVQRQVEKNQREYYLTEQIKAIQKELGREDQQSEINQLRAKVKTLGLTTEAQEKVEKELHRLEQMPPLSSEAVVSRNWIDWVVSLPWNKTSKDSISLDDAEQLLDKTHAGLKKAKERIIEFIAAKKFSTSLERAPIICLVGPPGVGKTSLGNSIAASLGREFIRISLGGIRDEAEIRGHRRTYIGSLPGKIIQAMRKASCLNPVILLDEIDKMSSDLHGDPSSALLEVLDPEQNKTFVDHFLELEYDLSKVMFITTANHIEGIPYPLFDRMDVITLTGYTEQEKLHIATEFLLPKNLQEYGLKSRQFKLSSDIIRQLINNYTKEAGVRQLERLIAKLMRKSIQLLLKEPDRKSVMVTTDRLKEWLGNAKFKRNALEINGERIGLALGLAWTEVGGDVLEIEAAVVPGKGALTLTGQLGEVMQESAHAALSYIRSRASDLGFKSSFYSSKDIHLHIPEGATPKDGPSAGITMCAALVSALTKNPLKQTIAMTGEITLRGRVLPVGGLKEKILAAKQHGITTILLSKENKDDVEEFSNDIGDINLIFVDHMDEVLNHVITKPLYNQAEKVKKRKNKLSTSPSL
jgi:ATP-dependent Lon protease